MPSSSAASVLNASTVLELEGHIIDSLTLARVLDLIQNEGGQYQLNDLQIGNLKANASSATLTVFAKDDAQLEVLIEKLQPFGIRNLSSENALLGDTDNPKAFTLRLPQAVKINNQWLPIAFESPIATESEWVIAINNAKNKARLTPKSHVKPDETIVTGHQGLQWS